MSKIKDIFIKILKEQNDSLDDIHPNQLKFLRGLAAGETGFSDKERRTDRYNMPKNNRNVRDAMRRGMSLSDAQKKFGDYGNYQTNVKDVQHAEKLGVSPDTAKHLHGGGREGTSTLAQQTKAAHEYISRNPKWSESYNNLKTGTPEAYETARKTMGPPWFALKNNKPSVQNVIGTRTSGPAAGMFKTGPAPGSFRAAQQTSSDVYPELNKPEPSSTSKPEPSSAYKPQTTPSVTSTDRTDIDKTLGSKIPDVSFSRTGPTDIQKVNTPSVNKPSIPTGEPPKGSDQYTNADKLGASTSDLTSPKPPETPAAKSKDETDKQTKEYESGGKKKKMSENKKYINLEHTIRIIAEKKMQKESGKDSSDKAQDFIRTFVPSALGLGVVSPEERKAMTDAALKSVEKRLPAAAKEQFKKPEIKQELEKIPGEVAKQQKIENIANEKAAQTPAGKAGEIAAIATGVAGLARGGLQVAKRVLGNRSKKPSSLKKGAGAAAGAAALDALSGSDGPTRGLTGVDATHGHRPTTGTSDTSAKRKIKESVGFGSDKYEGVPSVFTKPIPTIGPDHERTSEKNSSERKRNKQLNSKTLHGDVSEENEDRKKIKNVARPDSDNPKSYKSELGRQGQIKTKIIDESLTKNIFVSIIKESVLSAYSPQTSNRNRNKKTEGGISSSRPGLGDDPKDWKTWKVRTLDQYNPDDPASYVTVAGHPSHYGKKKTINNISYTTPSGETKELTNVRAYVHDTGRAFKNKAAKKGERFDVAVGKDMPGSLGTQPFSMKKHDIRMGWDEPQEKKPEPPAKQDEPVTPSVSSVSKPEKRASLNALSRNIAAEKNKDNEEQQRKKDREEHDKMWAGSTNAPKEYESGGKRKNNKNPLVVLNPPLKHDIQEQSPQRRPGFSGQMQRNLRAGPAGTIATTPEEERQQYKDVIRTIVPGVDAYQKYKEGDVTGAATSAGLDVLSLGTGGAAIKGAITLGKRYLPKLSPKVSATTGKVGHTGATIGAKEVTGGTSATPPTTTVPQPKPPTPTAPTPTAVAAGVGTGVAATTIPSSTAQPKPTEEVPIPSPSPAQSAAAAAGREMPTPAKTEPKAPTSSVTPSAAPSSTPSAAPQKPSAPTNIPKPAPAPTKSSGELPDWKQSLERTGGFSFEDGGKKKRKMSESIVLNYIQNNKKINK